MIQAELRGAIFFKKIAIIRRISSQNIAISYDGIPKLVANTQDQVNKKFQPASSSVRVRTGERIGLGHTKREKGGEGEV